MLGLWGTEKECYWGLRWHVSCSFQIKRDLATKWPKQEQITQEKRSTHSCVRVAMTLRANPSNWGSRSTNQGEVRTTGVEDNGMRIGGILRYDKCERHKTELPWVEVGCSGSKMVLGSGSVSVGMLACLTMPWWMKQSSELESTKKLRGRELWSKESTWLWSKESTWEHQTKRCGIGWIGPKDLASTCSDEWWWGESCNCTAGGDNMARVSTVQTNPVLCCLLDGDSWAQPSCISSSGAANGHSWGTVQDGCQNCRTWAEKWSEWPSSLPLPLPETIIKVCHNQNQKRQEETVGFFPNYCRPSSYVTDLLHNPKETSWNHKCPLI